MIHKCSDCFYVTILAVLTVHATAANQYAGEYFSTEDGDAIVDKMDQKSLERSCAAYMPVWKSHKRRVELKDLDCVCPVRPSHMLINILLSILVRFAPFVITTEL